MHIEQTGYKKENTTTTLYQIDWVCIFTSEAIA